MGSVLYRWKKLVNDLPTSFLCSNPHHENPGDTYTVQRVGYFRVARSWVGLGFFFRMQEGWWNPETRVFRLLPDWEWCLWDDICMVLVDKLYIYIFLYIFYIYINTILFIYIIWGTAVGTVVQQLLLWVMNGSAWVAGSWIWGSTHLHPSSCWSSFFGILPPFRAPIQDRIQPGTLLLCEQ